MQYVNTGEDGQPLPTPPKQATYRPPGVGTLSYFESAAAQLLNKTRTRLSKRISYGEISRCLDGSEICKLAMIDYLLEKKLIKRVTEQTKMHTQASFFEVV